MNIKQNNEHKTESGRNLCIQLRDKLKVLRN
jgi:hypothetical protein